jgi:hypothetical protein
MVSLAKLLRIRQGIEKKYKNMGLEKFLLSFVIYLKTTRIFFVEIMLAISKKEEKIFLIGI